ncbi:MAG TPA: amidohydrolase [Planctomycetaceae bacterium]|nr:amidohydrolase [Planctomycetaceae bacterium]
MSPSWLLLLSLSIAGACRALSAAEPPAAQAPLREPGDLVLLGGKIVTLDDDLPEAQAIAISDGRIVAVGRDGDIRGWIGDSTRVIDLGGRLVVPGFIESHGHFLSLGRMKLDLDLKPARTWDEVVELVAARAAAAPAGQWIVGRGWHQEKWERPPAPNVEGYPVNEKLSRASPENPVLLIHGTGHAVLANVAAMELAGITRDSTDPPGGTILRDAAGEPTGVLRETAQGPVHRAYERAQASRPESERLEETRKAFELATAECLESGVTSFQDAGSSLESVQFFREQADRGRLKVRLWVMLRESNARLREVLPKYRLVDHAGGFLTVRAIKCMADGALGSHGALLLEAYRDLPGSSGLRVQSLETVRETALLAARHDFQVCTHAIGDRANREVLDLYQQIFRSFPERRDWRWRIEHAQHLHPADIPRFTELGVIASMQGVHATSDAPFVVARLGAERARTGAYAWRSLLDAGAIIANGTDAPVEDLDPIVSFYSSVTRRVGRDGTTFFPEQRMTRLEALRSYTRDAAFAAFEERDKGTLTPGKRADLVVLSQDLLTVPEDQIPATRVKLTIVGGEIAYSRAGL